MYLKAVILTFGTNIVLTIRPLESEEDWKNLVNKFCADAERLIQLVEKLPEEKLQETFVDEKYGTYLRNIDVIIEHSYYHFGQVVLLRKMIERASKT